MDHLQEQVGILDAPNLGEAATMHPGRLGGWEVLPAQGAQAEQGTPARRGHRQSPDAQGKMAGSRAETETGEQGNAAERILTAFRRLGATTSDNRIAREVGCSRKTVARWKKRFQERGLLSAASNSDQSHLQPSETPV